MKLVPKHKTCSYKLNDHSSITYRKDLRFKFQKIMNSRLDFFGMEILIDSENCNQLDHEYLYKTAVLDKKFYLYQLASIIEWFLKGEFFSSMHVKKGYVFVNLERSVFCDQEVIQMLIELSDIIRRFNFNLVVEVTERKICINCMSVTNTIEELKKRNIYIALDDFNYLGNDFRMRELLSGVYDFVKLDCPRNLEEIEALESLYSCYLNKYNLIFEKIETISDLELLSNIHCFAYQGFLFHKGTSI